MSKLAANPAFHPLSSFLVDFFMTQTCRAMNKLNKEDFFRSCYETMNIPPKEWKDEVRYFIQDSSS